MTLTGKAPRTDTDDKRREECGGRERVWRNTVCMYARLCMMDDGEADDAINQEKKTTTCAMVTVAC